MTAPAQHPVPVTRLGFSIIFLGAVLIALRVAGLVDTELADIMSVLGIVVGALIVAVDGERTSITDADD